MKTIKISDFKQRCLSLLLRLEADGLVVTKYGKPIARVLPFEKTSASLLGRLKGKLVVKGKILKTGVKWHAQP